MVQGSECFFKLYKKVDPRRAVDNGHLREERTDNRGEENR